MLRRIAFDQFRGFLNFEVTFGGATYLVGPNNAGKSTILNSLRVIELHVRLAQARRPTIEVLDSADRFNAYPANLDDFPGLDQSARHDFGNRAATVQVDWDSSVSSFLVWPEIDEPDVLPKPYFYLRYMNGGQPHSLAEVRQYYSPLGMVPTLSPLDDQEAVLKSEEYIRRNISGRLSSRHFRNQLWLLKKNGEHDAFLAFANEWTDEIQLVDVVTRLDSDSTYLDVFYVEGPRRHERELAWAGDGLQIWLQILYHVYRTKGQPTLILDEPEVFLHPDLQKRLVRLLKVTKRQIIVATHSSELLSEVESESVVLIDRSLRRAKRMKDDVGLTTLGQQLGSTFNLRLAKALKSKVAVFVEGKDRKLLTRTAARLGLNNVATESGVAFIPTDGFDGHRHLDAFGFLCRDYLKDSVKPIVILDRDYKSDVQIRLVESRLNRLRIVGHVWAKKELENYYLDPITIGALADISEDDLRQLLLQVTDEFRHYVSTQIGMEKADAEVSPKADRKAIMYEWQVKFEDQWRDLGYRLSRTPAKDVLAGLNRRLQDRGIKAVSFPAIASSQEVGMIDPELVRVLETIEDLVGQ